MTLRRLIFWTFLCFGFCAQMTWAAPSRILSATMTVWSVEIGGAGAAEPRFLGSAFAIGDKGTVVTNAHVVGRADAVYLETATGARIHARVTAVDGMRDLALLRPARAVDVALIPAPATPGPGQTVYAAGGPLGTGLALTAGIVSALDRQIDPHQPVRYLQHSAPVNPGSSGGPLTDEQGRVLGINTRIVDGSRYFVGIAYAVPVGDILDFVAAPDRPAPVNPGLRVRAITGQIAAALELPDIRGVLVEHVVADGPAAVAGVQPGDILLRLGAGRITRPGDIALLLAGEGEAGKTMPLSVTIYRDGREQTLALNLRPPRQHIMPMSARPVQAHTAYSFAQMGLEIAPDGTVSETTEGSAGYFAGLTPGDRIVAVNGKRLETLDAGWHVDMQMTQPVLVLLRLSDGSTQHVLIDPWADAPRLRPSSGANVLDQDVVSFE